MDKKKTTPKKEARHQIEQKIEAALVNLKTVLGDKEFEGRVKKAAKIFAKGFKVETPKEKVAAPKNEAIPVAKKVAVKKAAKKVAKKK